MWQEVCLGHSLHNVLNGNYLFTHRDDLRNDMTFHRELLGVGKEGRQGVRQDGVC